MPPSGGAHRRVLQSNGSSEDCKVKESRKVWLWLATCLFVVGVTLGLSELAIRIFSPTEYLYPRYQFSREYGMVPFSNVVMVHGVPGKYRYRYTVNAIHSRGEVIEPGLSKLPTVVVLGDSYSFGIGVSDGEEYPSVMRRALSGHADVVNLASPGWGLTQEIRRYYELGARYHPNVVVLQFCANDPEDDFSNQVTQVKMDKFVFADSKNSSNAIERLLSLSPLQGTQVYNFFRTRASLIATWYFAKKTMAEMQKMQPAGPADDGTVSAGEAMHISLLSTFARHLHDQGISLWMIAADNQLRQFPHIERAVHDLNASGDLHYFEVVDWLGPIGPHSSPEGHLWDTTAHRVIGEHLAAEVSALSDSAAMGPQ